MTSEAAATQETAFVVASVLRALHRRTLDAGRDRIEASQAIGRMMRLRGVFDRTSDLQPGEWETSFEVLISNGQDVIEDHVSVRDVDVTQIRTHS